MKKIIISLSLISMSVSATANAAQHFADEVLSFVGGNGFGIVNQSDGSYKGRAGPGVYDPGSVYKLDGAILALGGGDDAAVAPGVITLLLSKGQVFDGPGSDLRVYDTFGRSEGFNFSVSTDGSKFYNVFHFAGNPSKECSPISPCATDIDLANIAIEGSAVSAISVFNITAAPFSVLDFPEAYDLDAVEVINFRPAAVNSVPEPGMLGLLSIGILLAVKPIKFVPIRKLAV